MSAQRPLKRLPGHHESAEMEDAEDVEEKVPVTTGAMSELSARTACASLDDADQPGEQRGNEGPEQLEESAAKCARSEGVLNTSGSDWHAPRWDELPRNDGVSTPDRTDAVVNVMDTRDMFRYIPPRKLLEAVGRSRLMKILEGQGRSWTTLSPADRLALEGAIAEYVCEGMRRGYGTAPEKAAFMESAGPRGGGLRDERRLQEIASAPELATPRTTLYARDDGTLSGFRASRLGKVNGVVTASEGGNEAHRVGATSDRTEHERDEDEE